MPTPPEEHETAAPMGFGTAVVTCLRKAAQARGRATRAEFWYFVLFCLTVFIAATLLGVLVAGEEYAPAFFAVPWLLFIVPWISAGMRRLHDTGRSGGWCFLLPSALGLLIVLILWTEPSQPHANRYG
jgi:uncharacterized membrane protein YhaH (DUF805 family)